MENKPVFSPELQKEIKSKFYYVDEDPFGKKRLFFENSGGSLRLKACVEAKAKYEMIPDCPMRYHDVSQKLHEVKANGVRDLMEVIFGAAPGEGALVTELTPSRTTFSIMRAIVENVPGKNVVTTSLEHPSAYDALKIYAEKRGMEFRVAQANPKTGGVDVDDILSLVDKDTCVLSVMSASNISGYVFPMKEIITRARAIKPDLYVVSDAVQHQPHQALYAHDLGIDALVIAPYKAFGIRGCGYGYVSDRAAVLPHDKLEGKDPKEWELGTYPHGNFAAMSAMVDYVCWLGRHFTQAEDRWTQYVVGMQKAHEQETALLIRMLEGSAEVPGLRHIPGVEVYFDGPVSPERDLVVAMGIKGMDYTALREEYGRRGVLVFERINTSIYSKRIVESLGQTGLIRVSPIHCHDFGDIDQYLKVTAAIAAEFAKK